MVITITISRSVSSDGLLWPLYRHTHPVIWLCGPVQLACSCCLRWSLLYMFHAEGPRHRLEAGTTWNIAHRIMCFRHTGFYHSSVLLCLMLSIINWHAHSWVNWFFCWALCKYFALVWTPKSINMFTKYCHILNHLNHVRIYTFCLQDLCWCYPSIYVFSILQAKTAYAIIVLVLLYTIFWTIWIKSTPILPLSSRSVSISSFHVRFFFPIISFLLLLYMPF